MKRRDADHYPVQKPSAESQLAGTMFDGNAARKIDTGIAWPAPSVPTPTSESAAAKQTDTAQGRERRESQNIRILTLLASRESGFTRDELAAALNLPINVICIRVSDLDVKGYVDRTSELTRPTRTNSPAQVLFITAKGRGILG